MPVLPEKREAGGVASGRLLEQLRGDWAEMRVLQWFRGVCPRTNPRTNQKALKCLFYKAFAGTVPADSPPIHPRSSASKCAAQSAAPISCR